MKIKVMLSPEEATELSGFIDQLAWKHAKPDPQGIHRLNPNRVFKLGTRYWENAVKSMERHDPSISPLMAFVKGNLNKSALSLARLELKEQMERGEPEYDLRSLDEVRPTDEGTGDTLGDTIEEDRELVRLRHLAKNMDESLSRLDWPEQMALGTLAYDDRQKIDVADFLGISRPTLDKLIRKAKAQLAEAMRESLYTKTQI